MTRTVAPPSIAACAVLALAVVSAPTGAAQAAPRAAPRAGPVPRAKALELFAANCAVCHGPEGAGTPLSPDMAFKNRKWKHGNRPQDVVATIINGVPSTPMLPFKGRLTPAEISALASLVRSFDKTAKPAGGKR
jgi:mono/diheme cytochrome c family protein